MDCDEGGGQWSATGWYNTQQGTSATTLTADPPTPGPAGTSKPETPDAPTKKETPAAPKGTGEKGDGKEDGNGGGTKTADASKTVPRQGAVASQDPPPQRSKHDDTTIAQGAVVGTVVSKGPSWVEVMSESGKTEKYTAEWRGGLPKDGGGPDKTTAQAIAKLNVGDRVRLQWRVNDHVRIVSIAHAE
jgi:hypothetical protein